MRTWTSFALVALALALVAVGAGRRPAEAAPREIVLELPDGLGAPRTWAFSPDGKLLACGTGETPAERPTRRVGPPPPEREPPEEEPPEEESPGGDGEKGEAEEAEKKKPLVPGHVLLFDTKRGELEQTLSGHEGSVDGIVWSEDGKSLASVSNSEQIALVWSTKKKAPPPKVVELPGAVHSEMRGPVMALTRDAKGFLFVLRKGLDKEEKMPGPGALTLVEVDTGATVWTEPDSWVSTLLVRPKNRGLVTVSEPRREIEFEDEGKKRTAWTIGEPTFQFRDLKTGEVEASWAGIDGLFRGRGFGFGADVALTRDGRSLVHFSYFGVTVREIDTQKVLAEAEWPDCGRRMERRYYFAPRRGLALRAGRRGETGMGALHFDLIDVATRKGVREADGPKGRSVWHLAPELDRLLLARPGEPPVLRKLPWGG